MSPSDRQDDAQAARDSLLAHTLPADSLAPTLSRKERELEELRERVKSSRAKMVENDRETDARWGQVHLNIYRSSRPYAPENTRAPLNLTPDQVIAWRLKLGAPPEVPPPPQRLTAASPRGIFGLVFWGSLVAAVLTWCPDPALKGLAAFACAVLAYWSLQKVLATGPRPGHTQADYDRQYEARMAAYERERAEAERALDRYVKAIAVERTLRPSTEDETALAREQVYTEWVLGKGGQAALLTLLYTLEGRLNEEDIDESREMGYVTRGEDLLAAELEKLLPIRRQAWTPAGYPADFIAVSPWHGTLWVIEVDGSFHNGAERQAIDTQRTVDLNMRGIHVLRVDDAAVKRDPRRMARVIAEAVNRE